MKEVLKYIQHLPTCYTMQDWSEAERAFADTPSKFRDPEYDLAVMEMQDKRSTCNCGAEIVIEQLETLSRRASILERLVKAMEEKDTVEQERHKYLRSLVFDNRVENMANGNYTAATNEIETLTSQIAALKKEAGV